MARRVTSERPKLLSTHERGRLPFFQVLTHHPYCFCLLAGKKFLAVVARPGVGRGEEVCTVLSGKYSLHRGSEAELGRGTTSPVGGRYEEVKLNRARNSSSAGNVFSNRGMTDRLSPTEDLVGRRPPMGKVLSGNAEPSSPLVQVCDGCNGGV